MVSRSEQILGEEKKEFRQFLKDYSPKLLKGFNNFNFDLTSQASEDLRITLPVEQDVILITKLFSHTNGVYGVVSDVEREEPIWVYVY